MSWTNQPDCSCTAELTQLASLLPTPAPGPFEFSLLTTLAAPLEDLLKCVERCKQQHTPPTSAAAAVTIGAQNQNQNRSQNPEANRGLVPLADSILAICHAACAAYDLLDDGGGTGGTTSRSPGSSENTPSPSIAGAGTEPGPAQQHDRAGVLLSNPSATWRCIKTPMVLGSLTLRGDEEALLARQIVYTVLTSLSALLRVVYIQDREAGQDGPLGRAAGPTLRAVDAGLTKSYTSVAGGFVLTAFDLCILASVARLAQTLPITSELWTHDEQSYATGDEEWGGMAWWRTGHSLFVWFVWFVWFVVCWLLSTGD